ncbi:hypothetical protein KR009_011286 [Drosophila setifemur]|nr:hypothetical protein KR009_011286 [Drosophila setifemur]
MFSIFGKRKPAETPTEEPIQGPADPPRPGTSTVGDEFVFVERKPAADPMAPGGGLYPYGALPYPPMPGPRPGSSPAKQPGGGGGATQGPVNYLQDIPFVMAPGLAGKDSYASAQMQVDSILALLTRQMSVDELAEEYTFALERSVQNECY